MKHVFKFTHIVAVVFAAVTMLGFTACNDEVNDNMTDLKTSLEKDVKDLQDKADDMEAEILALQSQIGTIQTCNCDFQKVVDLVNDSLKNYWNATQVQTYVNTQLNRYTELTLFWAARDTIHNALNDIYAHLHNHCDSISDLYNMYNTLNTAVINANALASAANALAKADSIRIDALETRMTTAENDINNLGTRMTTAEGNITTHTGQISNLNDSVTTINGKITTLNGQVLTLNGLVSNLNDSVTTINGKITTLNGQVSTLNGQVTTLNGQVTTLNGRANALHDSLVHVIDTVTLIKTRVTGLETGLNNVRDSLANALALATRDSIRINGLEALYNTLHATDSLQQEQLDSIKTAILNFATHAEVNAVKAHADSLYNKGKAYSDSLYNIVKDTLNSFDARITTIETVIPVIQTAVNALNDSITALRNDYTTLKAQVDKNTKDIADLTNVVKDLRADFDDVVKKTIYGVVLNGTYNPVFGYMATPFGVRSNILMAYYGQNEFQTYFPTTRTSALVYDEYALTDKDAQMLGTAAMESFNEPGQTTFLSPGANAGKLFLTVNPNTADLTDATFTLVNSIGEESGIKLDTIKPSTEKLTFGYTGNYNRAPVQGQAANGFYEATATLDEAGIPTAKIVIDSELKQAVKDFYNTNIRNKSGVTQMISEFDVSSLTQLAQGIYKQFDGLMPAYSLKAEWTDSAGTHEVYSDYAIGAVAVKPLSYSFAKDKSLKHLPNISPISDLSGFNINMKDITFNIHFRLDSAQANIHLSAITVDLDGVKISVDSVPNLKTFITTGDRNDITFETVTVSLDSLESYLNKCFASTIDSWNAGINNEINQQVNSLINEINKQLNNFTTDVQGQLNSQIQSVVDDAQAQVMNKFNGYLHKINNYIQKVNRVINRFNRLLDNPNKFLQPILVYEGTDKHFHIMSTTKTIPTVFTGSGAIILHPTSFNAEIVAPAYKKFIGVTNVFKDDKSAQGDDPTCKAELDRVNGQQYFDQVIDGGRYGVAFAPASGYTYEIFYSALDYHGKISQRKYYVTVK